MPDPTKNITIKRDLATPLSESKFDAADYNRDGSVSPSEQRKYNKVQALKQKGAESLTDRQARRGKATAAVSGVVGTALGVADKVIKIANSAKKK